MTHISPDYFSALMTIAPTLLMENLAGALTLAGKVLPIDLEGETPSTVVSLLETVSDKLHDLDGRLPRPPAQSLYFRLFAGVKEGRPPPPTDEAAGKELMEAMAYTLLRGSEEGEAGGHGSPLAVSMLLLSGCHGGTFGLGVAGVSLVVIGAIVLVQRLISRNSDKVTGHKRLSLRPEAVDREGRTVFLSRSPNDSGGPLRFDEQYHVRLRASRLLEDGRVEVELELQSIFEVIEKRVRGNVRHLPRAETIILSRRKALSMGFMREGRPVSREEFGIVEMSFAKQS